MTDQTLLAKFRAKLAESGLDATDARQLGFKLLNAQGLKTQFPKLTNNPLSGFLLPYFDRDGKAVKQFYRFRYLDTPTLAFGAVPKHGTRYVQPAGQQPRVYFPRTFDWDKFFGKSPRRLFITEGELKAACACAKGIPTIALGGVWNFRSAAANQPLIDDLLSLPGWDETTAYICYDSDAASNPQVLSAENELARQLTKLKADVYIGRIPPIEPGRKTGLDDYLVSQGVERFVAEVVEPAEQWAPNEALHAMNERSLFLRNSSEVYNPATRSHYNVSKFLALTANVNYSVQTPDGKGGTKLTEKNAGKEWLKWAGRADMSRIDYVPGGERVLWIPGEEWPRYNVWPGWGVEPLEGRVDQFKQLVLFLTQRLTTEERDWFWKWMAYPIQYSGTKLFSNVLIWGSPGTGKSFLGELLVAIYGLNGIEVNDSMLMADFNEWAKHRQFVVGSEIGARIRKAADLLKGMITQETITINPKFVSPYTIKDTINYLFNSNHPNAAYLEEKDRRTFVIHTPDQPLPDSFYTLLGRFKRNGGAGIVRRYLESIDLAGFEPSVAPPVTAAKRMMIATGQSDAAVWAQTLRENPEEVINKSRQLIPPARLHSTFEHIGNISLMTTALQEAGFRQAYGGKQIKISKEWGMQRLWVLAGKDEWTGDSLKPSVVEAIRAAFLEEWGPKKQQGGKF
jgi:hypothetical protein